MFNTEKLDIYYPANCVDSWNFAEWLRRQGHQAVVIGSFAGGSHNDPTQAAISVNGVWTTESAEARRVMNDFWARYCRHVIATRLEGVMRHGQRVSEMYLVPAELLQKAVDSLRAGGAMTSNDQHQENR